MRDNRAKLSLITEEVPIDLHASIMLSIKREARRSARIRFTLKSFITIFSAFALVISLKSLIIDASASGFFDYVSLMFSDISALFTYPKELFFALVDAIPLLGLASVSVAAALGIWSFTKGITDARTAFLTA